MENIETNEIAISEIANEETIETAPEPEVQEPEQTLIAMIQQLQKQITDLQATNATVPKNHRPGRIDPSARYVRLGPLSMAGKVPQQQFDLAQIIAKHFPVGEPFSQAQLYEVLAAERGNYRSLYTSVQNVTYLFRYYLGLRNNGKQAGFTARNFLRGAEIAIGAGA